MNDETSTTEKSQEGPVGGERLRAARRANDISVGDVAKELHLDEHKVRALEKNEFDVLGAPVFAKGHLRKYANLVGVDVDDVMTDYYQMNRAAGAPPVVGPKRKVPREIYPVPWIAGGVVAILVIAAAYWWFASGSPEPVATVEPETIAPFVSGSGPESAPAREPESTPEPAPDEQRPVGATAELLPVASEIEPEIDVPANQPTPGVAQVEVDLTFTGDCWTEVSDASGRRLFYDLGQEGRVVTVSGDAPLRVILGDADNVSVTVDGQPWPIPAAARRGRLARLSISPQ